MAEHARFEKLVGEAKKNIQEISPQETAAALERGDTLLIDVRDPDEYRDGFIEPATNISRGFLEFRIGGAAKHQDRRRVDDHVIEARADAIAPAGLDQPARLVESGPGHLLPQDERAAGQPDVPGRWQREG